MTQTEPIGNLILSLKIGEPVQVGDAVVTILEGKKLQLERPGDSGEWLTSVTPFIPGDPWLIALDNYYQAVVTILCQKSRGNFSVAIQAPKSVEVHRL